METYFACDCGYTMIETEIEGVVVCPVCGREIDMDELDGEE